MGLASKWGKGSPRRRSLAGLGMISHTGTEETRPRLLQGGSSGNIAQWAKPDAAMPRV